MRLRTFVIFLGEKGGYGLPGKQHRPHAPQGTLTRYTNGRALIVEHDDHPWVKLFKPASES